MFAYCNNTPVCANDCSGHQMRSDAEDILFVFCFAAACYAVASKPVSDSGALDHIVEKVKNYVRSIVDAKTEIVRRDQTVYVMCYKDESIYGKNTVGYVGRTNDLNRRTNEHRRDHRKDCLGNPIAVVSGLTKDEAKIVEQLLISTYTLDQLENYRREIGINNISAEKITDYIISLEMGVAESEILCLMER